MDKKMTSGEIAKKVGISQKAVRLYDEKGLLKPSEYSEGNYRLYDKEALLVLEKIIALKQIGYSLEEIYDNLIAEKNMDIRESLEKQLSLMEAKKQELERAIGCIRSVLVRSEGEPDWNSVAEIARLIQVDQSADDRHFDALKHTADEMDWYVKIYNSLELKGNCRVLDLGCGFAKLWRNNWADIPAGMIIKGYDLHGSWADNFAEFVEEHKGELASGTDIDIRWKDVEETDTWEQLAQEEAYDYIIAHYLLDFLSNKECFIQRAASVLAEDGLFSCNGYAVSPEDNFWKEALEEMKLSAGFVTEQHENDKKKHEAFRDVLEKYFTDITTVELSNKMRYDSSEELFERACRRYPEKKKFFADYENKFKKYFENKIQENGAVIIETESEFWHCKEPKR